MQASFNSNFDVINSPKPGLERDAAAFTFAKKALFIGDTRNEISYPFGSEINELLIKCDGSLKQVFELVKLEVKGKDLGRFFHLIRNLKEIEKVDMKLAFQIRAWEIYPFADDESGLNSWLRNFTEAQASFKAAPQVLFIGGASSDGKTRPQRFLVPIESKGPNQPCYRYYIGSNRKAQGLAVKYMSLLADLQKAYSSTFVK